MCAQPRRPNVLFILADDLGWSDLNFCGHKKLHTPNIDKLASQGVYFTDAYASAPVSSPTRASIMTGKTPAELHLTCHIPGIGMSKYLPKMSAGKRMAECDFDTHLQPGEQTIANLMKSQGYATAFIGKWHLAGDGSIYTKDGVKDRTMHPENYGFDINIGGCSYGQPASYFAPYRNATIEEGEKGEYLTDRLGDEAVEYLSESREEPFFLMLAYYSVHTPYQVPADVVVRNGGNKYHAMIEKLDESVGKVLAAVEELERDSDRETIVIFYSDNGGLQENPPLAGRKGDLLEGGIRVPMIVKWSGVVAANTTISEPVSSIDIYPTLAQMSGAKSIEGRDATHDSRSLVDLLISERRRLKPRSLYWHFPHHRANTEWTMSGAIRKGDWKLIYSMEREELALFNLRDDQAEQHNLAKEKPRLVQKLYRELTKWQRDVDATMPVENR